MSLSLLIAIVRDSLNFGNAVSHGRVSHRGCHGGDVCDGRPIPDAAGCHAHDDGPNRCHHIYLVCRLLLEKKNTLEQPRKARCTSTETIAPLPIAPEQSHTNTL